MQELLLEHCDGVRCSECGEAVTFSIRLSPTKLAVADLTRVANDQWYFSRLNVPEVFRGKGYGRELLKSVIKWCDDKKTAILLEINAHAGAGFNLAPMYEKYGFVNKGDFWLYQWRNK